MWNSKFSLYLKPSESWLFQMYLSEHFAFSLQVHGWFLDVLKIEWEADPLVIRLKDGSSGTSSQFESLRQTDTLSTFKTGIKTLLFNEVYSESVLGYTNTSLLCYWMFTATGCCCSLSHLIIAVQTTILTINAKRYFNFSLIFWSLPLFCFIYIILFSAPQWGLIFYVLAITCLMSLSSISDWYISHIYKQICDSRRT